MSIEAGVDKDLISANLKAFHTWAPQLAAQLSSHTPQSKLVRNVDGDWDVEFRGEFLYGPGGRQRSEGTAKALALAPESRVNMAPLSSRNVDLVTNRFLNRILKRGTEAGLEFLHYPSEPKAFHLVSFGLGLGYHIPLLLEQVEPISVCIVEPNLDFLYHSLAVMDWEPILERTAQGQQHVTILVSDQPGDIARRVRAHLRFSSPIMVDWTRYQMAYQSPILNAAITEFYRDAQLIGMGLGFFHDEMEMVRASYMNLREGYYRVFKQSPFPMPTPVFIVGSGPSLDDDIEVIKAYKDRAVIISCGTAARVLMANGIKPDFQMLLENGAAPYRALKAVDDEFGYGDTVLIASNTVDPRVKEMFKTPVFYFRNSLSSYTIFSPGDPHTLDESGPTVTNTGLAAALAMGFRELYLFGVDLGTKSQGRHHSKDSLYRHDDDQKDGMDGAMNFDTVFDQVDVANFGGLAHTEAIMLWTRDALARAIGRYRPAVEVFNCSDGLLIENTRPMSSASIKLTSTPETKARDLAKAWERCLLPSQEGHFEERWGRADWPETIKALLDRVQGVLDDCDRDLNKMMLHLGNVLIAEIDGKPSAAQYFIRGTLLMSAMCLAFYARRVTPPDRTDEFWTIIEEEFTDILRVLAIQTDWFFENIEVFESDEELFEKVTEWRYDG
ncbi:hypothetical protein CCC_00286 [Paramagnetospirillum magnetotacticum MS-1]|uniref:Motility accessory factor n=1 Tax=Paramagnetospirillum magnetotacticum MS-1 TaxID=272627 RepID=A0A0C2YRA0_PARME|nr:flagellin glycosyltransferase Maf [Paramagnetospirillum magnetotacticum]KIL97225.1 hypothetical protein CCC_00286 [Paramagnetospirillum magnetotacticum MS-1]